MLRSRYGVVYGAVLSKHTILIADKAERGPFFRISPTQINSPMAREIPLWSATGFSSTISKFAVREKCGGKNAQCLSLSAAVLEDSAFLRM